MGELQFKHKIEALMGRVTVPARHAGRIRGEQREAYLTMVPFGLAASAVNILIIMACFITSGAPDAFWMWAIVVSVVTIGSLPSGLRAYRRKRRKNPVRKRALRRPVLEATLIAMAWAMAPALLLPLSQQWQIGLLICVGAGMMSGGGYTLSPIPNAAKSFVMVMSAGICIGVARGGVTVAEYGILLLLGCYTFILIRCVNWNYGNYVRSWLQEIKLEKQASDLERQKDTISVLLKDFEESSSDCLWEMNSRGEFINMSSTLAQMAGVALERAASEFKSVLRSVDGEDGPLYAQLKQQLEMRRPFSNFLMPVLVSGEKRWWNISGKPVFETGKLVGFRGVVGDVTDARRAEARIAYLAHYDSLTGLSNRAYFTEALEGSLYRQAAHGETFAVVSLDLDFFKYVNDVHGHDVGDMVLRHIAGLLKDNVGEHSTVARVGGDEFAILMSNSPTRKTVMATCDRLAELCAEPFEVNSIMIQLGSSVGVAFCPDDATTVSALLKCADLALYRAKNDGRGRARYFELEMDQEAQERRLLEQELKVALREQQFELFFQPLVDSVTGQLRSCETLLRWRHPERGVISPDLFISLTEQTGMIVQIGEWVIRTALAEAAGWDDSVRISINLSPVQVKNPGLVAIVTQAIAHSGIAPERIEFEITESVLLEDSEENILRLHDLRALGVHIALDDFGTGYSSLSYLRAFPFDKIKIDKSFVTSLSDSEECRAIVRAVTELANSLGMRSTAEGVETVEQVEELIKDGCQELQGFYFSEPVPADDLVQRGVLKRTPVSNESLAVQAEDNDKEAAFAYRLKA